MTTAYTHHSSTFANKDGINIFHQRWTVEAPQGALVIAHGLGEHSGRYANIVNALAGKNISCYAMDHRGHGRSGGKRGHVNRFMDYVDDLGQYLDTVVRPDLAATGNPRPPLFLLGHSMGGVISTLYVLTFPDELNGLILSSPGLILHKGPTVAETLAIRALSKFTPGLTLGNRLNSKNLSHDPETIQAYLDDPLVHDRISMRLVVEFMNAGAEGCRRANELALPLLLVHGEKDRLTSPAASKLVYEQARSADKTLHIYPDLFHETMNETPEERSKVLQTIVDWIMEKIGAGAS